MGGSSGGMGQFPVGSPEQAFQEYASTYYCFIEGKGWTHQILVSGLVLCFIFVVCDTHFLSVGPRQKNCTPLVKSFDLPINLNSIT